MPADERWSSRGPLNGDLSIRIFFSCGNCAKRDLPARVLHLLGRVVFVVAGVLQNAAKILLQTMEQLVFRQGMLGNHLILIPAAFDGVHFLLNRGQFSPRLC